MHIPQMTVRIQKMQRKSEKLGRTNKNNTQRNIGHIIKSKTSNLRKTKNERSTKRDEIQQTDIHHLQGISSDLTTDLAVGFVEDTEKGSNRRQYQ
jgi:hypothetical protein